MKIKYSVILLPLLLATFDTTMLVDTGDSFSDIVAKAFEKMNLGPLMDESPSETKSHKSNEKVLGSIANLPGDKEQPFSELTEKAIKKWGQEAKYSQAEQEAPDKDEPITVPSLPSDNDDDETLVFGDMFTIKYRSVREALLSEPSKIVHGLVKSADDRLGGLEDFAAAQAEGTSENEASNIARYLYELGVSAEEYRSRAEMHHDAGNQKSDLVYALLVIKKSIPNAYPLIRRYERDAQGVFDALSVVYGDVLGSIDHKVFDPCDPNTESNPACRIDAWNVAVIGARQSFDELQTEARYKYQGTSPIAYYNYALASPDRQRTLFYLLHAVKAFLASGKKAPLTLLDTIEKQLQEIRLHEDVQDLVQTAKEEIDLASKLYEDLWQVAEDDEQALEQAIEDFEENYPLNPEDYPAKHLLNHYHLCQLQHGDEQDCYLFLCAIHHADKSTSALSTSAYGQCVREFKEEVQAIPAPPGPLKDFLEATHTWSWIATRQAQTNVKVVLEKVAEGEKKLHALEQELLAIQEAQIRRQRVDEDFAKMDVEGLID